MQGVNDRYQHYRYWEDPVVRKEADFAAHSQSIWSVVGLVAIAFVIFLFIFLQEDIEYLLLNLYTVLR